MESRRRAYIKIEEGCDRFCTYCIIPLIVGLFFGAVFMGPGAHQIQDGNQRPAPFREAVFHLGRYLRVLPAPYEPIGLQRLQRRAES